MPIRFRCQDCRSRVKVPQGSQGKQVKCPRCGCIQSVPIRGGQGQPDGDLTVHTLVGSMHKHKASKHKTPKRKEALVGAGVDSHDYAYQDRRGGGAPGGLDIPPIDELESSHARGIEQDEAFESQKIVESRRRVQDLFATSHSDDTQAGEDALTSPADHTLKASRTPQALLLNGRSSLTDTTPAEPTDSTGDDETTSDAAGLTLDLSAQAYPFLRLVPWVLRLAAVMLIGLAFKAMLLVDAQGYSFVVCMLVLFAGFTMVAVTWTVGEIARAVRDIAMRRACG